MFGIGTDLREAEWRGVVRQLLAQGLLAVEGDYGTLVLTDAQRRRCCAGERQVMLRREPERAAPAPKAAKPAARPPPVELPAEAAPVFERLRAWRAATAKEQGVPAYVIFHDATLRQIATDAPDAPWPSSARSAASARTSWPSSASRSWTSSPSSAGAKGPEFDRLA